MDGLHRVNAAWGCHIFSPSSFRADPHGLEGVHAFCAHQGTAICRGEGVCETVRGGGEGESENGTERGIEKEMTLLITPLLS